MSKPNHVERWLRRHRTAFFDDPAPADPHVAEERIAGALEGRVQLNRREHHHLGRCTECRYVAAELAPEVTFSEPSASWGDRVRAWLQPPVPLLAGALAAIAIVWIVLPQAADDTGYRARGVDEQAVTPASVALVATSTDGMRRDVRSGDALRLSDRIGFRYGNPAGAYSNLTVVGWDGEEIHWYYPEAASHPPQPIRSDPQALGLRLPFDIRLRDKHKAGRLVVVAEFDADPVTVAESLQRNALRARPGRQLFELTINP